MKNGFGNKWFESGRKRPKPEKRGQVVKQEGGSLWIDIGDGKVERVYVEDAKPLKKGTTIVFTTTGMHGLNKLERTSVESGTLEVVAPESGSSPEGAKEGEREYEPNPELFEPPFITGVVVKDMQGLYLSIDRDGYDRRVKDNVPASLAEVPKGAKVDDIIVLRPGEAGEWVLHKTCGRVGDAKAEVEALAFRSGVDTEFSPKCKEEVSRLWERYRKDQQIDLVAGHRDDRTFMEREATTFISNEGRERQGGLVLEIDDYRHGENRLDLRNREDIDIFTIDPTDAKDYDDAISYREVKGPDGKKRYEIGVHIADVSHFARLGSAIEKDARLRQFTRYLKQMTVTMLPEALSNTLCSLEQGKDRLAFSTIFTFNEDGTEAREPWFGKSIIKSKSRLAYDQADVSLHSDKSPRGEKLRTVQRFTQMLREKRKTRGAIAFDQRPEAKIEYDKNTGKALRILPKKRQETSLLIEDLMLAANEAQGEYLGDENLLLLRAHLRPKLENVIFLGKRVLQWDPGNPDNEEIVTALKAHEEALAIKDDAEREAALTELQEGELVGRLINNIRSREETVGLKYRPMIQERVRSLLKSAIYTTKRAEHISLAVEPYLHATSPIRRYPDLIVQYLLDEKLRRREGVTSANVVTRDHLNEVAERANIARYQAKRAEQDVLELAVLDLLDKEGAVARDVVVESANTYGVRVGITLEGGYEHVMEIPWSEVKGVQKDARGNWVYGREGKSALHHFGPTKDGYRSITLTLKKIVRKDRHAFFDMRVAGRISVPETREVPTEEEEPVVRGPRSSKRRPAKRAAPSRQKRK